MQFAGGTLSAALDPKDGTTIDWYVPSPDGRRIAVSLSEGGSERHLHVVDVATGERIGEVMPRVSYGTALGSAYGDAGGRPLLHALSARGRAPAGQRRLSSAAEPGRTPG